MALLEVVIASTRPGRVGLPVAEWFVAHAVNHGGFDVEVADLAEIDLPLLDEPNHPRLRQYTKQHTLEWSARIERAGAFVFVTPEYNYGPTAALINAISYLNREWHYKPAGFVSYGGVSGGTRSVQMSKQVLTTLKVVPLPEAVILPFVAKHIDAEKKFSAEDWQQKASTTMLDELLRWTNALRTLRP